ncbi:putative FAD-binding dehydrogenase [Planctomycetes bacterium Pan216]|uniref:Putative FAD-binding dehydrogenase n=1 Tax=Kolteria novifilia TaxID=2527975 RepID=A0A518B9N5_9BACT|nr:putative FAD-binding dehydrogenase [Planctomycetes bacterium Pan216]
MPKNRREFLTSAAVGAAAAWSYGPRLAIAAEPQEKARPDRKTREIAADVVIVGAGLGGCAAALAALRNGLRVILTEPTDWIGGQLTSQAVPPDEHGHIEHHGANRSYRELREAIRDYYRRHYPLTPAARANPRLNPGNGSVSRLCHEPWVAVAVLEGLLAPYCSGGRCILLREHEPIAADVTGDAVRAVQVRSSKTGRELTLHAPHFIDASELGDLLPLTRTEFVIGAESRDQTRELHAAEVANPLNQQAFTMCFAADYRHGEHHVIDRPDEYRFWSEFVPNMSPPWPGRLLDLTYSTPSTLKPKELSFDPALGRTKALNLFRYRQIADVRNFEPGTYAGNITLVNWPQNDYVLGPLVGVSSKEAQRHIARAKQLSLSLLYWLQTEAPRPDGGTGFPGLCLRRDLMGTEDGLAKAPYVRESRRIRALFTITEEHVGRDNRSMVTGELAASVKAATFPDSVGVGSYHIDLHPSSSGENYIDFRSLPFQIPLGALLPQRMTNLIAANKNIGTTHITNGCYRLHPVEWGIGEAAGCLVSFVRQHRTTPHAVHQSSPLLRDFQKSLHQQGVETNWPG